MNFLSRMTICLALVVCTSAVFGQITTGSFSGIVTDRNGSPLPGAAVSAVHEPTGTRYEAVTRDTGIWKILNVRVGGPYMLTANMSGFKTQIDSNVFVKLGEDKSLEFSLSVATIEEELVVVGSSNPIINPTRAGSTSNVAEEAIEALPSISRSFEDFARTNPYFSTTSSGDGSSTITVAGRSNKYNTILIDGAVNNDLFGLSASGAPGGQAESPFISLDAIQEVQLLVTPFDVRQSGFSGGGVNAVTRYGTNRLEGSIFHYFRTEDWIGDGPLDNAFGDFDEKNTGFRIGGPIIKDKLFYFFSAEQRRKSQPNNWASREGDFDGDGKLVNDTAGSGQNFGHVVEAQIFRQLLMDKYGYDPGGLEDVTRDTDSDSFFLRFDYNLGTNHQLTLRHNYVDAENLRTGNDNNTFQYPGDHQFFPSETNATVLQVNSTFGSFFNEFRLSYTTVRDRRRGVGEPFPWIEIERLGNVYPELGMSDVDADGDGVVDDVEGVPGAEFEIGTERFSTANSLDQDVLEITNDFTFFAGDHTLTIGTHNEIFNFDNLFIRENFGAYEFRTLLDFANDNVRRFNYSFSADPDNPLKSAKFDVFQIGLYVGDQWAVTPDFNVTMGFRADIPLFPDTPTRNPLSEEVFNKRTDVTADGNILLSPRFGFNWDINGNAQNQLRGGIGVFSGRTPYVWLSNQYSNTGIEFQRISSTASGLVFEPDPFNQPQDLPTADSSGNEIDLIDDDFKLPQVMRYNLAYDRDLGFWGLIGTVEYIYSENLNEILYQNLNWTPSGENFFDGRPMFEKVDSRLRDVIFLKNTSQGSQTNASIKIEHPYKNGLYYSVSYLNGEARSVNDGTSSQARSNWRFLPTDGSPNDPPLGTSVFEVEHRINASVSYRFGYEHAPTTVSFFYNAQSGRPFSTSFRFDVNGDGESNDLFYVPASASEVIIDGGTWDEFNAYIEADDGLRSARGSIVERNASKAPWRRTLDFRLTQDVSFKRYKFQLTFDILNVMNLLDNEKGAIYFVNFNNVSPVAFNGTDEATGLPIYNLLFTDPDQRFALDDLRSRYQMQLGLRFSF